MRQRTIRLAISASLLLAIPRAILHAQGPVRPVAREVTLPLLVAQFQSANDSTRIRSFYGALRASKAAPPFNAAEETRRVLADYPQHATLLRMGLIRLLERENAKVFSAPGGSLPEIYGDYHGDLIRSVAALEDPQAVEALYGALPTGGMASRGIARLGSHALSRLLEATASEKWDARRDAGAALGAMADDRVQIGLDAASVAKVRTALLRMTNDKEAFVRQFAARGLNSFDDSEVRGVMQRLAASSADCAERAGHRTCPVRDAASEYLAKHVVR